MRVARAPLFFPAATATRAGSYAGRTTGSGAAAPGSSGVRDLLVFFVPRGGGGRGCQRCGGLKSGGGGSGGARSPRFAHTFSGVDARLDGLSAALEIVSSMGTETGIVAGRTSQASSMTACGHVRGSAPSSSCACKASVGWYLAGASLIKFAKSFTAGASVSGAGVLTA